MDVTFTRTGERRYGVYVDRPGAPRLQMHPAPGYDPLLPHDMVHLAVELECGIALGVFGQLAAGGDAGTFHRADGVRDRGLRRRGERLVRAHGADLARSEELTARALHAWHRRSGALPGVCARLDALSKRWRSLRVGEAMSVGWPAARPRDEG